MINPEERKRIVSDALKHVKRPLTKEDLLLEKLDLLTSRLAEVVQVCCEDPKVDRKTLVNQTGEAYEMGLSIFSEDEVRKLLSSLLALLLIQQFLP